MLPINHLFDNLVIKRERRCDGMRLFGPIMLHSCFLICWTKGQKKIGGNLKVGRNYFSLYQFH